MSQGTFSTSVREVTPEQYKRVRENFVNRVWNVFGSPNCNDVEAFIDEYVRALARYDANQLAIGCDRLFATMKKEFRITHWPTIAECREACKWAAVNIYGDAKSTNVRNDRASQVASTHTVTFPDSRILAIIRPDAKRACEEGWIVGLYDFACKHGHLPSLKETEHLIEAARDVRNFMKGDRVDYINHQGEWKDMDWDKVGDAIKPSVYKLGQAILERRTRLEQEFRTA